jgi:hypothetical protein
VSVAGNKKAPIEPLFCGIIQMTNKIEQTGGQSFRLRGAPKRRFGATAGARANAENHSFGLGSTAAARTE